MNEFTKDELELICAFFNIAIEDFKEPDSTYILRDKIQSMIDNYCEHSERVATSDDNGHMLVMCGRCDLVLWHEKD